MKLREILFIVVIGKSSSNWVGTFSLVFENVPYLSTVSQIVFTPVQKTENSHPVELYHTRPRKCNDLQKLTWKSSRSFRVASYSDIKKEYKSSLGGGWRVAFGGGKGRSVLRWTATAVSAAQPGKTPDFYPQTRVVS